MKHGITLLALAAALAIVPAANADSFLFTGDDGSTATVYYTLGSLDNDTGGTALASGSLTLTCGSLASAECYGSTFSLSSLGSYGADNELYLSGTILLSEGGLLFTDTTGTTEIQLYYDSLFDGGYTLIESYSSDKATYTTYGRVPEPSSWLLLASGIFGLATLLYRKNGSISAFLNM